MVFEFKAVNTETGDEFVLQITSKSQLEAEHRASQLGYAVGSVIRVIDDPAPPPPPRVDKKSLPEYDAIIKYAEIIRISGFVLGGLFVVFAFWLLSESGADSNAAMLIIIPYGIGAGFLVLTLFVQAELLKLVRDISISLYYLRTLKGDLN